MTTTRRYCKATGKVCYEKPGSCLDVAKKVRRRQRCARGPRMYRCKFCGEFHLTTARRKPSNRAMKTFSRESEE